MRHQILGTAQLLILLFSLGATATQLAGQTIVQTRGVDSRVDYAELEKLGPWDDRNYQLTLEDLALLSPREEEMDAAIPVFYRVELRQRYPELEGVRYYPRSALNRFFIEHDGYLVDGKIYRAWKRQGERKKVILEDGIDLDEMAQLKLSGEARVTNPTGGAESAIAIKPTDPNFVIAGSNGPASGQNMHFSSDGGATWTFAGGLPLGSTCCDPTVGWSIDGSKAYTATLGNAVYFYRSADNGQSWTDLASEPGNDPRREIDSGFVDKEYLHVDMHPTSPHADNIYLTWHKSNQMRFSRSTDLGHTWSPVLSFSSAPQGIGSDITTDKSGNVYYLYPALAPAQAITLLKSTDGGATFGPHSTVAATLGEFDFPLPAMPNRRVFIYVSADADLSNGPYADSIYAAWTDSTATTGGNASNNHGRIQVAYSRDGGNSWTVTTPHETADAQSVDRFHEWLRVGPDGTVYVIFYDTRNEPNRTGVDLYYSLSTDGAQSWSTPMRLTSVLSPQINDFFEWGDYNGLDVVMNDLIAIYTDNRNESGGAADSVDVYAAGTQVGAANEIFSDGFESGSTTNWTSTTP